MSYNAKVIEVLIASPSDVQEERRIARDAIHEWNAIHSKDRRMVLIPRMWEHDSAPEVGERPQEIINRQLLQDADLLIAVFWTRIGSPTGKSASGTVEEIEEHIKAGKTAMLYFSSTPVVPDELDPVQYEELKRFKIWARQQSLYHAYSSPEEFGQAVRRHLAQKIIDRFPVESSDLGVLDRATLHQPELPRRSTPKTEGPSEQGSPRAISTAAEDLLAEAIKDPGGTVVVARSMGGTSIASNRRHFGDLRHPRDAALYMSALKELVSAGLMEERGRKGEVFAVTHEGYERKLERQS